MRDVEHGYFLIKATFQGAPGFFFKLCKIIYFGILSSRK